MTIILHIISYFTFTFVRSNDFVVLLVSKAKINGNSELYIKSGSDINLTCIVLQTPEPPSFIYW